MISFLPTDITVKKGGNQGFPHLDDIEDQHDPHLRTIGCHQEILEGHRGSYDKKIKMLKVKVYPDSWKAYLRKRREQFVIVGAFRRLHQIGFHKRRVQNHVHDGVVRQNDEADEFEERRFVTEKLWRG